MARRPSVQAEGDAGGVGGRSITHRDVEALSEEGAVPD